MLCENCGENEANVSYTQIINGVKKEMHLCNKCAKNLGISYMDIGMPSFNMPISLSSFLGDLFEDEKDFLPEFEKEQLKCDKCGMTYEEFIDTGKFGCGECYENLSKKINPILKNIHGGTTHIGRKLNTSNMINESKQTVNNNEQNVVEPNPTKNKELDKLKAQLKVAIQEERYEDAAKIRDEIKKLEK